MREEHNFYAKAYLLIETLRKKKTPSNSLGFNFNSHYSLICNFGSTWLGIWLGITCFADFFPLVVLNEAFKMSTGDQRGKESCLLFAKVGKFDFE